MPLAPLLEELELLPLAPLLELELLPLAPLLELELLPLAPLLELEPLAPLLELEPLAPPLEAPPSGRFTPPLEELLELDSPVQPTATTAPRDHNATTPNLLPQTMSNSPKPAGPATGWPLNGNPADAP